MPPLEKMVKKSSILGDSKRIKLENLKSKRENFWQSDEQLGFARDISALGGAADPCKTGRTGSKLQGNVEKTVATGRYRRGRFE